MQRLSHYSYTYVLLSKLLYKIEEREMTLEEASQLSTVIGSLAIFGIIFQIYLASKQIKADHERSRREKAVELIKDWSKSVQREQTWARKLVEQFSAEQCRYLFNQSCFDLPKKLEPHLHQFFEIEKDQKKNGSITLTEKQVVTLRWYIVSYLNLLEAILVSWQYSVVDREIIEHEFSFLFSPEQGHFALSEFRSAAGGQKTYPAIEIFANHLEEKRRSVLKEKANIA